MRVGIMGLLMRYLAVVVLLGVILAGCSSGEASHSEAGSISQGTTGGEIRGVSLSASIRRGHWYVGAARRYRFDSDGAEYAELLNGFTFLFKTSDNAYFTIEALSGDQALLPAESASKLRSMGASVSTDSEGEWASVSELKRLAIAGPGDWVTLLAHAPIESTENTISVSWSGIDPRLADVFKADDGTERLRIEDDGLKLVRISNEEVAYVLE